MPPLLLTDWLNSGKQTLSYQSFVSDVFKTPVGGRKNLSLNGGRKTQGKTETLECQVQRLNVGGVTEMARHWLSLLQRTQGV